MPVKGKCYNLNRASKALEVFAKGMREIARSINETNKSRWY